MPLCAYFVCMVWLTVWLVSAVFVFSVGEPVAREDYPLTQMKWDDNTRYIFLFQLFMLFWINAFIMGMCQFIIAASACIFPRGGLWHVQRRIIQHKHHEHHKWGVPARKVCMPASNWLVATQVFMLATTDRFG